MVRINFNHFKQKTIAFLTFYLKAAMYGRTLILKDLINAGADINSKTDDDETAMMLGKLKLRICIFYLLLLLLYSSISIGIHISGEDIS